MMPTVDTMLLNN